MLPCPTGTIIRTETDTYDYPGCHVLPGFVDSHAHIVGLGKRLTSVSLHDARSAEECAARIAAASPSQGGWIQAMGWNQELWEDSRYPSTAMLDDAIGHIPVVASRVDGHALWTNSAAKQAAGLTDTADILADDAMAPIWIAIPAPTSEELKDMIVAATAECARNGITEVHDMDVDAAWLDPMRELAESGRLPVRVQSFLRSQHNEWDTWDLLPAVGEFLRVCGVKMFADGALGSHGAALLAPYADRPDTTGTALLSMQDIVDRTAHAIDAGWWCVATHAIGDAAVRTVLDAYERIRRRPDAGPSDVILRIEHAQHVHPDDVRRMAELDVFACIQPTHCLSDASMAERRLGHDRLPWAYRWRSLLDAGIRISSGSDFPIEPPSPIDAIDAFVRRIPRGHDRTWQAQECITRAEALMASTSWAHAAADMQYRRGSIEPGFDADVVVVDQDLHACPDDMILRTQVMATFTAGKLRYGR